MKSATREWVQKAEEDFLVALDLARRRKRPRVEQCLFHAQQCAEKYIKARMEEAGLRIPRTHDLRRAARHVASSRTALGCAPARIAKPHRLRRRFPLPRSRSAETRGQAGTHRRQSRAPRDSADARARTLSAAKVAPAIKSRPTLRARRPVRTGKLTGKFVDFLPLAKCRGTGERVCRL